MNIVIKPNNAINITKIPETCVTKLSSWKSGQPIIITKSWVNTNGEKAILFRLLIPKNVKNISNPRIR